MSEPWTVVIGVGNEFRRDDGIGPALVEYLRPLDLPRVRLVSADGEPTQLLDAWAGADLAVIVDAVLLEPSVPGRIHRTSVDQIPGGGRSASSHGLGIPEALMLAQALDRIPRRMAVFAVEAAHFGYGNGLSAPVAAALPDLADAVLAELRVNAR
jgi:hydrogenase maturation protease